MRAFVLTTRANEDLNEIWGYIAADSHEAADRVMNRMENTFESLVVAPGTGHYRLELADARHRFKLVYS